MPSGVVKLYRNNILKTPVSFFDTTPLGRILNRLVKDTDIVDNVLPVYIGLWLHLTFMVIIPVFIIYYLILCFYISTSRQLTRLESITRSPIYSHFSETINGVNTIRAYNMEDSFIEKTNNLIDINSICYYPYVMSNTWLTVRLGIMGNILVFFAALFAVINRENISPGTMGLSLTYAFVITQNLSMLIQVTSSIESNIVAVERIKEYSDIPQEETLKKNQTTIVDDSWPSNGYIEFCNLSLRYRDGLDLVLKELSFVINGNEKIGIIGRTGSGKSSLTLALFRIIEAASGKILIDGIDISKLSLSKLRSKLTIIPQDPVLFGGSLRMNLDPFDIHEDEAIWTALERSHLKSFVTNLPDKLHHEISEGGDNLSTGQRQLICLARALLRKTKILILDEATAGVDFETDDLIQQTIKNEFSDCTIITIAHRLNTIIDSDRVMVLDKGSIVEFDCPDKLMKNQTSVFYSMAKNDGLVG
ncbi:multidrug resistance-associated protein 1-like [Aphidius gifuensis]|uniref:multidrug resistance-associated protein 1-like n=1 Tax=Aphidius gifuensis TaxID=684658 RepID=UPI001CDC3028|nr:multidrug resistance-associated protein 1-like [Aphidius gifuensis]